MQAYAQITQENLDSIGLNQQIRFIPPDKRHTNARVIEDAAALPVRQKNNTVARDWCELFDRAAGN